MCPDRLLLALFDSRLDSVANSLRQSSREMMILLLFAVLIGVIWMTIFLWDRFRRTGAAAAAETRSLFDELCAAHRLKSQDITLLAEAARECRLESPASLFLRPERFDPLCAETQPQAEAYQQLRDRLFGNLA
jgi:hypothetical protein